MTPLLFTSLKLAITSDKNTEILAPFLADFDDFLELDSEQELLLHLTKNPIVIKTVEMIARSYLQDSHKYEEESEYWLSYAENLATEMLQDEIDQHARFGRSTDTMRMPALMKRIQVMRIALFID